MPIRFECENSCIAIVDIDLGGRNTFNISEMNEMIKVFEERIEKELDLKAILIKSSNPGFFATGPAIGEIKNLDRDGARHYTTVLNMMIKHIQGSPLPVVCSIKGITTGVGLDIVSAADFRFASGNAVFSDLTSKVGLLSSSVIALRLFFLIGAQKAKEIVISGNEFTAEELYKFNYLTNVFESDELLDKGVDDFMAGFKNLSIDSLRVKKRFFTDLWENFVKNNSVHIEDAFSELLRNGKDWKNLSSSRKDTSL